MTEAVAGPRLGPPTPLQRNLVFGTIGATIVLGWIGDALWASLVDRHPLTLILLNAKPRYLVLTVNALDGLTYTPSTGVSGEDAGSLTIAVADGTTYAVGDAWMLPGERPDWLGEVTRLVPLPSEQACEFRGAKRAWAPPRSARAP